MVSRENSPEEFRKRLIAGRSRARRRVKRPRVTRNPCDGFAIENVDDRDGQRFAISLARLVNGQRRHAA
jgi:hypothetical protein